MIMYIDLCKNPALRYEFFSKVIQFVKIFSSGIHNILCENSFYTYDSKLHISYIIINIISRNYLLKAVIEICSM